MTASVIVCTRNRAKLLEGCLTRVLSDRPSVPIEVIVIDNGSTDDTRSVVESCRERATAARLEYQVEERLGHSHARNRGIAAAGGDYLIFTDDDVLVEPGWVDALCAGFSDPDVVAVGGRVLPKWPSPPPSWMSPRNASVLALTDYGDGPRDLVDSEFPIGPSMAIRAAAVGASSEPFDARLGHRGDGYFGYDEYELFNRLRSRGRLVYRPGAVVLHRILPERMTWEGMRRASLHNGFGSMRADRLGGKPGAGRRVAVPAAVRAYASALRQRRRNGGRDDVDPEAAFEEFRRYWMLGRWIEILFGDSRVSSWLLARLV